MPTDSITIEQQGRRYYLRGNTYPIKDRLRAAGCKWDPDARCWYTGKRDLAEQIAGNPSTAPTARAEDRQSPGDDAVVAGKATYKGKTYYAAGKVDRGRTHYDDRVVPVTSRDGSRVLLYSRDGKLQFWAPQAQVVGNTIRIGEPLAMSEGAQIVKSYSRPTTIGHLRRFAEDVRNNGGVHPDACPNCGSTSCSTAYGRRGLCDED